MALAMYYVNGKELYKILRKINSYLKWLKMTYNSMTYDTFF